MRFAVLPVVLFAAACANDAGINYDKGDPRVIADGAIKGRVCDPTGRTWLADAQAYVNVVNDGVIVDTKTAFSDLDGYWTIDGLPGERDYTYHVQYGPDELETDTVWIGNGETVELDEPDCFDPLELDVAIVLGDYDDFDLVLNEMGFANYFKVNGLDENEVAAFLNDPAELAKYDIIFFNGGFVEEGVIYDTEDAGNSAPATRVQNIVDYVNNGGSIYASDWAYDVVEIGWPERADFVGDDTVPGDAQKGDYENVSAAISDTALAEHLGTSYLDVTYDLPVWPPVVDVADSVSVHVAGNVPYSEGLSDYQLTAAPLLYSFNSGDGKVVFSTFRVARNANDDIVATLQYMMYRL
ncbi:MAG: carboxypeptidase-like regulatory domain-containing protein [Myxococcota bacterium]